MTKTEKWPFPAVLGSRASFVIRISSFGFRPSHVLQRILVRQLERENVFDFPGRRGVCPSGGRRTRGSGEGKPRRACPGSSQRAFESSCISRAKPARQVR